jgi:hypothetical protein
MFVFDNPKAGHKPGPELAIFEEKHTSKPNLCQEPRKPEAKRGKWVNFDISTALSLNFV